MKAISVLGRLPKISLAELESVFGDVKEVLPGKIAEFEVDAVEISHALRISRFGGSLKFAIELNESPLEFLKGLPGGKITLGLSDYSKGVLGISGAKKVQGEALKLKKILARLGRSIRVIPNKEPILSTATSHHNQIGEKKNHVELIKLNKKYYSVVGVQNISEYAKRDQARPARDAKVGMLPPKLAQILINLNGNLPKSARILDPFCGTGVILQEAILMDYSVFGTDLSEKMIRYSEKNLGWFQETRKIEADYVLSVGDAVGFDWCGFKDGVTIDAVAAEVYLGSPMSKPPAEIKLRQEKEICQTVILGFLRNLARQIRVGTPVTLAIPAWLRENGQYSRLNILDEIEKLGYNLVKFKVASQRDLLYFREGQIVAREIISLRKK